MISARICLRYDGFLLSGIAMKYSSSILLICLTGFILSSNAQPVSRFDIVIDELLPDPNPAVGLPNAEFLELKNRSSSSINLRGWKIVKGNSAGMIRTDFMLAPDSLVVICSSQAEAVYAVFGSTIGISGFPALGNDGDTVYLLSPEGMTVHALAYDKSWYQNTVKSEGGWSLEMIDTRNPCSGYTNWEASTDSRGGTPGTRNSVNGDNPDQQSPALLRIYTADSITVIAVFDEPLDSSSAAQPSAYFMDNSIGIPVSATPLPPLFSEVRLVLPAALNASRLYQLTVSNVEDCAGNAIGALNSAKAGLPVQADTGDIVINEILFNPPAGGSDYVEFYNRSNKITDLKQLYISGRDINGNLSSIQPIALVPHLFFPGEYYVITENSLWVQQHYPVNHPDKMIGLSQLPSLPDDEGDIVLLNQEGRVIDELHYDHKWHFALIDNEEGIALERIDYNKPTRDPDNWSSAASTVQFGTPTDKNSQFRSDEQANAAFSLEPELFSPDNDGYNDYCFIHYRAAEPGYVANISIFDASGRIVCHLAQNITLGSSADFRWDGLNERKQKLPSGVYVVMMEIFNLQGKTKKWKHAVVLARRF